MKLGSLLILILIAAAWPARAQDPQEAAAKKQRATSGELYETIARMDAAVFEAFNAHDIDRLMAMFTDDVEFYDDGDGLNNYAKTKAEFVKMFASTPDIQRELLKETLEVYPLKDYGAIEIGEHRFCHVNKGHGAGTARMECGVTKVSMVWRKVGETWKLSRVLSYSH